MLKATITLRGDGAELEKLFSFEDKEFQNERAKYETKLENDELSFIIEAKDSTALRTVMNTITKLLSVHEKTKDAIQKWKQPKKKSTN